jgi:hypothetical protein
MGTAIGWILPTTLAVVMVACTRELTPDERGFYERARALKVGATLETVKRTLGEPSRVIDAQEMCRSSGGQKEWIYESVETIGGTKPLRAGSIIFCSDQNTRVVAILNVD